MRTVENLWEMRTAILPWVRSRKRRNTSYSARASRLAVGFVQVRTCASSIYGRGQGNLLHWPAERLDPFSKRRRAFGVAFRKRGDTRLQGSFARVSIRCSFSSSSCGQVQCSLASMYNAM